MTLVVHRDSYSIVFSSSRCSKKNYGVFSVKAHLEIPSILHRFFIFQVFQNYSILIHCLGVFSKGTKDPSHISWLSHILPHGTRPGYVKIAIEHGPVEIVSFPMKNGGSFHSYGTVYQRVSGFSVDVFDDRPIFRPWSSAKKVWKKVTWNRTQVDASQLGSFMGEASRYNRYKKTLHYNQWKFQDPKLEVLYHIRPYFLGIFPYIGLKHRPYIW